MKIPVAITAAVVSVLLAAILTGVGWTLSEVINLKVAVGKLNTCECQHVAKLGN
jgi:hypothetical protein